jgi:opacity protein-like surface antigen
MKKLTIFAGLMVLSTSAFTATNNPDFINAQKGEVKTTSENKDTIAKGFKIGLGASSLKVQISGSDIDKINEDLDSGSQLTLGYNNIRVKNIGWNAEFNYLSGAMENQEDYISEIKFAEDNLRLSINATYGIDDKIYTFAGINSSSYVSRSYTVGSSVISVDHSAGIGYQLGAGYQLSKNIGIELAYLTMNSDFKFTASGTEDSDTFDIETKGTQINLTGTF